MREIRRIPRAVAAGAAAITLGVSAGELFADSTINLRAHSAYVSEAHATTWLPSVPSGHAVAIRCSVHVTGDAHIIDPTKLGSGYGASTWQLTSQQGKGFYTLAFKPALKVALLVDGQTVTVATIDQLAINSAVPEKVSYPFHNSGKLHVVSADWMFTSPGTHTLQCLVDAGHTVKETKEADNQAATKVSVIGPATQQGSTTSLAHGTLPTQQPATTRGSPGRVAARSPESQKDADQKKTKSAPGARASSGVPPQDPPASGASGAGTKSAVAKGRGERVTLNPQPEPPSSRPAKRLPDKTAAASRGGPIVAAARLTTTAAVVQPAHPSSGQKIKVVATVRNEGGLPSQAGLGILLVCREVPGQPKCPMTGSASATIPSLGPGESSQASVLPTVAWPVGRYELVVGTDVIFMKDARTVPLVVK